MRKKATHLRVAYAYILFSAAAKDDNSHQRKRKCADKHIQRPDGNGHLVIDALLERLLALSLCDNAVYHFLIDLLLSGLLFNNRQGLFLLMLT